MAAPSSALHRLLDKLWVQDDKLCLHFKTVHSPPPLPPSANCISDKMSKLNRKKFLSLQPTRKCCHVHSQPARTRWCRGKGTQFETSGACDSLQVLGTRFPTQHIPMLWLSLSKVRQKMTARWMSVTAFDVERTGIFLFLISKLFFLIFK